MDIISTPNGDVTIRPALPEDAAALLTLRLESLRMHPVAFVADIDKTTADGVDAWTRLIDEYAANNSGTITVAAAGTRLVGMAGLVRGHWPKTRHFATLWGVYVQNAWRGNHISQAMIEDLTTWSVANGVSVIYLGVTLDAQSAIRCYTRCGFTSYGVEPKAVCYHDAYYDQLLMVKLL